MHRTATRFFARLPLGVFVFAQFAWAAYACSEIAVGSMGVQRYGAVPRANALTGVTVDRLQTQSGSTDLAEAYRCVTHCQFGKQYADSSPASTSTSTSTSTSMVTLLAGDIALLSLGRLAGYAAALTMANRPPPRVDPPHAILHCCLRI
jgi:hypothetical protein